jgi:hypothetical protein
VSQCRPTALSSFLRHTRAIVLAGAGACCNHRSPALHKATANAAGP